MGVRKNKVKISGKEMLIILTEANGIKYTPYVKTTYDRSLKRLLKDEYDLSISEYYDMVDSQENLCKICKKESKEKRLSIDHCHKTGKVRGLLCQSCNWGLGHFKDDVNLLKKAILYLNPELAIVERRKKHILRYD